MNHRFFSLLVILLASLLGLFFYLSIEIKKQYESANNHYDHKRYQLAAHDYLHVLDSFINTDSYDQAVYRLSIILRDRLTDKQLVNFFNQNTKLHSHFLRVVLDWRTKTTNEKQARLTLEYLQFKGNINGRANERLYTYLDERLPPVIGQSSHGRAWGLNFSKIANASVDSYQNLWILALSPTRIIRLDDFGNQQDELRFTLPDEINSTHQDINFTMLNEGGFFVGQTYFNNKGHPIKSLKFDLQVEDSFRLKNNSLLLLFRDGFRVYNENMQPAWDKTGHGKNPESFTHTQSIASNDVSILVLSWNRIQLFDLNGNLKTFKEGGFSWAWDAALDSNSNIYLGSPNGKKLDIYDNKLIFKSTLKVKSGRVFTGSENLLFAVSDTGISAYYPRETSNRNVERASNAEIKKQTLSSNNSNKKFTSIEFTTTRERPHSHLKVHASTQWKYVAAHSPNNPSEIWLGTEGGLLQHDLAKNSWKKWTVKDGLPSSQIKSMMIDETHVWLKSGHQFVKFDRKKEIFEILETASRHSFSPKSFKQDPLDPDKIWMLDNKNILHYSKSKNNAQIIAEITGGIDLNLSPDGNLLINDMHSRLLLFNKTSKIFTPIVTVESIVALTKGRHSKQDVWINTMEVDKQRNGIWLGMYYDRNIYFYSFNDNSLVHVSIDPELLRSCRRGRANIKIIDNQHYFIAPGCVGKLSSTTNKWDLIGKDSNSTPFYWEQLLKNDYDDSSLWLVSNIGLHALGKNETSGLELYQPTWNEPKGFQPQSIVRVDSKLWIGNRPVSIYDLSTKTWSSLDELNAHKLRLVNDRIIALSNKLPYSINPTTLAVTPLRLGKRVWQSLNDLVYDGTWWWAVGGQNAKDSAGLRAWNGQIEKRWTRKQEMPFGEAKKIILDPVDTNILWLATPEGLVRFSKDKGKASLEWDKGINSLTIHENRIYAFAGQDLLIWDCEKQKQVSIIKVMDKTGIDNITQSIHWNILNTTPKLTSILNFYPGFTYDAEIVEKEGHLTAWLTTHDGILEIKIPQGETSVF